MLNIDVRGIDRIILKLEQRLLDYQNAVDVATDFARDTIIRRAKLGQLTDGSYMTSTNPYRGSRYARTQYIRRRRNSPSLSTLTHNLSFTGNLHKNFVVKRTKSINKKNITFSRTIEFNNTLVAGRRGRSYSLTYAQLATIHEAKGRMFSLSPSQMQRVIAKFKQTARL